MKKNTLVLLFSWLVLSLLVAQCAPAAPTPLPASPTSPAAESSLPYPAPPSEQPAHTPELPTLMETPPKTAPTSTPRMSPTQPDYQIDTEDWLWYRNHDSGYEFKYPPKLHLMEADEVVILHHSIEYENTGDCDMFGGDHVFPTLEDFKVSFEVIHNQVDHELYGYDFTYNAGLLEGYWIYQGAQGCGDYVYYFPLGEDKTLLVTRAAIQALSGVSFIWDLDEILQVPGVKSKEEAEAIFYHILASFRFMEE